jgi:hypothetical protein
MPSSFLYGLSTYIENTLACVFCECESWFFYQSTKILVWQVNMNRQSTKKVNVIYE